MKVTSSSKCCAKLHSITYENKGGFRLTYYTLITKKNLNEYDSVGSMKTEMMYIKCHISMEYHFDKKICPKQLLDFHSHYSHTCTLSI